MSARRRPATAEAPRASAAKKARARRLLDRLEAITGKRELRRGEILFAKGAPGEELFGVMRGRLKISASGPDGRGVVFGFAEPGDLARQMIHRPEAAPDEPRENTHRDDHGNDVHADEEPTQLSQRVLDAGSFASQYQGDLRPPAGAAVLSALSGNEGHAHDATRSTVGQSHGFERGFLECPRDHGQIAALQ